MMREVLCCSMQYVPCNGYKQRTTHHMMHLLKCLTIVTRLSGGENDFLYLKVHWLLPDVSANLATFPLDKNIIGDRRRARVFFQREKLYLELFLQGNKVTRCGLLVVEDIGNGGRQEWGRGDEKKWKYNKKERRVDELIGSKSEKKPEV